MHTLLAQLHYPLIQAPMAGVQDADLAIAVCRAGALGSLPAAMFTPAELDAQLQRIRAATDAPYNLNFFAHRQSGISDAARAALQDDHAEHTALTNLFSGGIARCIVNRFMREAGYLHPAAPPFPHAGAAAAFLRKAAEQSGNHDFSPHWAGQNARLARPGSTAQIVAHLFQKNNLN